MAGLRAQKIRIVRQIVAILPRLPQARFRLRIALVQQIRMAQRQIGRRRRLAAMFARIRGHAGVSLRRAHVRQLLRHRPQLRRGHKGLPASAPSARPLPPGSPWFPCSQACGSWPSASSVDFFVLDFFPLSPLPSRFLDCVRCLDCRWLEFRSRVILRLRRHRQHHHQHAKRPQPGSGPPCANRISEKKLPSYLHFIPPEPYSDAREPLTLPLGIAQFRAAQAPFPSHYSATPRLVPCPAVLYTLLLTVLFSSRPSSPQLFATIFAS